MNPGIKDEPWDAFGFDATYYDQWISLCSLYAKWLSTTVDGLENVPSEGPVLLVGNHAGLRLHDVMCLQSILRRDHRGKRVVRGLFHIGLEKRLFFGHLIGQYMGGVLGHPRNAEYLLEHGSAVLTYPEGNHATSKSFADRDRLRPRSEFGKGWARIAVRMGIPVVSVAASGFETAVPTIYRSKLLGRYWLSNADLYPVSPQSFVTLSVPALNWVAPFPVRTHLAFGRPHRADASGAGEDEQVDELWSSVYDEIEANLALNRRRRDS